MKNETPTETKTTSTQTSSSKLTHNSVPTTITTTDISSGDIAYHALSIERKAVFEFLPTLGLSADITVFAYNPQIYIYLKNSIQYYRHLKAVTSTWRRLNPFFLYSGQTGIDDVLFYMQQILKQPTNLERETLRFLTGAETVPFYNPMVDEAIYSYESSLLPTTYQYSSTSGNKFYSRLSYFKEVGVQQKERVSLKSLSHNWKLNLLVFGVALFICTALILATHGIVIPFMATAIPPMMHVFPILSIYSKVAIIIGTPTLLKFLMGMTKSRSNVEISPESSMGMDSSPSSNDFDISNKKGSDQSSTPSQYGVGCDDGEVEQTFNL